MPLDGELTSSGVLPPAQRERQAAVLRELLAFLEAPSPAGPSAVEEAPDSDAFEATESDWIAIEAALVDLNSTADRIIAGLRDVRELIGEINQELRQAHADVHSGGSHAGR